MGPARQAPADRARPGAGRQRGGDAVHGGERQAQRLDAGWPSTAGCPTTCARCSTAPATKRTSPTASAAPTPCVLAGKHCESGDVIVRDALLDDPRPGDVIVTPATGAYGFAMASNYNGVPRPPVVFCSDGDARVVVRRESFEDLIGARCPAEPPCTGRPARPRHRRRGRSPTLLDERAAEIERFNGRTPVISGVLTRTQGDFAEILAGADLIVEVMGGIEPAREYLLAAMRAGKDVVSANKQLLSQHGEELFALAREQRRAAALRGRGRRRGAGRAAARGVAGGHADRAHPRDRQRHDQLHPLGDGPRQLLRRRRWPRPSARAMPRPTRATTSQAATRRRRWRSSRGWRSARRCTWTMCRYEGIEHLQQTTWSTPASSASA